MVTTNLRLPDELHVRLKELAASDRRSLNALIVVLLERALRDGLQEIGPLGE